MRRYWLKLAATCFAAFMFIGFSILGFDLYRLGYQPIISANAEQTIVRIDKSTSASSFARTLKMRGLIQSERLFLLLIRMQGLTERLKAGIYQINAGESSLHFLHRVVAGDVLVESFRIIEGTTKAQVSINLQNALYLTYKARDWLEIESTFPSAEGLLLADTYHYDAGSDSKDLLHHANVNLQQYLLKSWQQRAPDLPYKTAYDLLIAASILEKEASLPREKRLISGVIVNRLRKKMCLQMDPTVIYALGSQYTGKLSHADLQIDSPYNSYRYRGLPPTPIAMVGKDAIDAAAHPEPTDYLYFVARGDGSHDFSVTYEQQKQAIARYQRKT